jgi:hypothetical protein
VRRVRVEDERGFELDGRDRATLGPEPASRPEPLAVEAFENPRDVGAGGTKRCAQILSITCLTTV